MEEVASTSKNVDSNQSREQQNASAPAINSECAAKRRKENSKDDDNCE